MASLHSVESMGVKLRKMNQELIRPIVAKSFGDSAFG